MWCIKRWSARQKARLLDEQKKLRRARATVLEELELFEDLAASEDEGHQGESASTEESYTTNSASDESTTSWYETSSSKSTTMS